MEVAEGSFRNKNRSNEKVSRKTKCRDSQCFLFVCPRPDLLWHPVPCADKGNVSQRRVLERQPVHPTSRYEAIGYVVMRQRNR